MNTTVYYQEKIEAAIRQLSFSGEPKELYEPIRYMMDLGGKRIRPVLVMMANELVGGREEDALTSALGIEVFHNFSLLHDDIMDKAPLRRSMQTVHTKWNPNIAILSGDTMFVHSCQLMSQVNPKQLQKVLSLFFQTAIEVCEGQQLDMNFEFQQSVSIADYLHMITLKTAVLLGGSLAIGAMCGNAVEEDEKHLYEFGKNLGIAFQLHDDLLDVYGDHVKFGKQVGGDILSNKKTFLLLTALNDANGQSKSSLNEWIGIDVFDANEKVKAVTAIYNELNVREKTEQEMEKYFSIAIEHLLKVSVDPVKKQPLKELAEQLMVREK